MKCTKCNDELGNLSVMSPSIDLKKRVLCMSCGKELLKENIQKLKYKVEIKE